MVLSRWKLHSCQLFWTLQKLLYAFILYASAFLFKYIYLFFFFTKKFFLNIWKNRFFFFVIGCPCHMFKFSSTQRIFCHVLFGIYHQKEEKHFKCFGNYMVLNAFNSIAIAQIVLAWYLRTVGTINKLFFLIIIIKVLLNLELSKFSKLTIPAYNLNNEKGNTLSIKRKAVLMLKIYI